jgi:hypothetical protein
MVATLGLSGTAHFYSLYLAVLAHPTLILPTTGRSTFQSMEELPVYGRLPTTGRWLQLKCYQACFADFKLFHYYSGQWVAGRLDI